MHSESLLGRNDSGDRLGSGLRTSESMTRTEHRFVMLQQANLSVPKEFGSCEIVDDRSLGEKVGAFVGAAARRATDRSGWKKYLDDEADKFVGVAEGLNCAKEETKILAGAAVRSVFDGTAWNAVMHTPAYLRAAANGGMQVITAMSQDAHAVDKFAASVAVSVFKASDSYTNLTAHDKGKVIGQVMFAMINPEGSTEGAEVALKAADRVATAVDDAVVAGIQKSMKAIEDMQQSAPELAAHGRQMLREYTRKLALTHPELEYAGVPRGYFDDIAFNPGPERGEFYAMAKKDNLVENWTSPDEIYRGDDNAYSAINQRGDRKSHIRMDGNLYPANPEGMYKGEEVTVEHHVDGRWNRKRKASSAYTSFSADGDVAYFGKTRITLDLKGLREAIKAGEVKGLEIVELPEIIKEIEQSSRFSKQIMAKHRANAIKHKEVLIKGIIPQRFLSIARE